MRPLNWEESAVTLQNLVRGLSPAPAAEGEIAGIRFKILAAKAEDVEGGDQPGTVLSADKKGILVRCGEGALRITQLQAPGGKRMSAADYLRGHPLSL
jgi:methionyl-tRNA formyltransferase